MQAYIFDDRPCTLGEGGLWHPERQQFFWVDILGQRLLSRQGNEKLEWRFDDTISALGWIDAEQLLVAGEGALQTFHIETGKREKICAPEADVPTNRSNDGRADPHGGFWIGTMGRKAEKGAGAFYRYYRGELRRLFAPIDIPNASSFSPDGAFAHFTDTREKIIWRQRLDQYGWPVGERESYLDLRERGLSPDGAIFDAQNHMWIACWGKSCVVRFAPDGREVERLEVPATNATCPAFGGAELSTLFLTTAREGLAPEALEAQPQAGSVFAFETSFKGVPEPRVVL